MFIRVIVHVFRACVCVCVCVCFPFGLEVGMRDLIVSFPDHCLHLYFVEFSISMSLGLSIELRLAR